jgi:hemolysin III
MEEDIHGLLPDGGGYYAETNPQNFVLEPWNAVSSLAFLVPVIYYMVKLKGRYREYIFITYCMPLLFLGGIGSTIFHAFRVSQWFLIMDVLPIAILTLSVSVYFWLKILNKRWLIFIIVPLFVAFRFIIFGYFTGPKAINFSYLVTGLMLFVPSLVYMYKTKFVYAWGLFWAVGFFVLAIIFRRIDYIGTVILPMGTHWLWHVSCAIGSFLLANYLYHVKSDSMIEADTDSQELRQGEVYN